MTADAEPMMEMNMTPLIDVMLVLIIMLIITIPKQQHAVSLTISGAPPPSVAREVVNIEVDFDGSVLWNGMVLQNRAALEQRLSAVARAAEPVEVHLRANKLAAYKTVAGSNSLTGT